MHTTKSLINSFHITTLVREFKLADQQFQQASKRREAIAQQLGQAVGVRSKDWTDEDWNAVMQFIRTYESYQQAGPICPPIQQH